MDSEDLWRAVLHDFNNLVTGLQGVIDLGDPDLPFDPHNHARLETILADGKTLIAVARAMALGRLPLSEPVSWVDWETGVRARLDATGSLFRCPVELVDAGAGHAPWSAPLLQDWGGPRPVRCGWRPKSILRPGFFAGSRMPPSQPLWKPSHLRTRRETWLDSGCAAWPTTWA